MRPAHELIRRGVLPMGVFAAVAAFHFVWLGFFPEADPAQSRFVTVLPVSEPSWLERYIETQSYWLSYSYALAFTFAVVALRSYLEHRIRAAKGFAVGGFTLSGVLAVAGCYLIGCCGSPMLIVYMNLFGASFIPLAKPLMAAITTVSIAVAWWWMKRANRRALAGASDATCGCGPACGCD